MLFFPWEITAYLFIYLLLPMYSHLKTLYLNILHMNTILCNYLVSSVFVHKLHSYIYFFCYQLFCSRGEKFCIMFITCKQISYHVANKLRMKGTLFFLVFFLIYFAVTIIFIFSAGTYFSKLFIFYLNFSS